MLWSLTTIDEMCLNCAQWAVKENSQYYEKTTKFSVCYKLAHPFIGMGLLFSAEFITGSRGENFALAAYLLANFNKKPLSGSFNNKSINRCLLSWR